MPIYDASGSTTGAGIISPITPVKAVVVAGTTGGVALPSGALGRTLLFGGQVYGYGSIEDHLLQVVAGSTLGAGVLTGTPVWMFPIAGRTVGAGYFYESAPEPIIGIGHLIGDAIVDRVPCPVSCTESAPSFRYGHIFTAGDLTLAIRDTAGNPFAPIIVLYRMFRVLPGGAVFPVGPPNRRPAKCGKRLGVYYATGTAGECGQPGDWLIEWRWQKSTFAPTQVERRAFRVLDAVLDTSVPDGTCRCTKYGWGD